MYKSHLRNYIVGTIAGVVVAVGMSFNLSNRDNLERKVEDNSAVLKVVNGDFEETTETSSSENAERVRYEKNTVEPSEKTNNLLESYVDSSLAGHGKEIIPKNSSSLDVKVSEFSEQRDSKNDYSLNQEKLPIRPRVIITGDEGKKVSTKQVNVFVIDKNGNKTEYSTYLKNQNKELKQNSSGSIVKPVKRKELSDYTMEEKKIIEKHWEYISKKARAAEEEIYKREGVRANVDPIGFDWENEQILKYWKNSGKYHNNMLEAYREFAKENRGR